jgi:Flp pilus assembly pilin Flp
MQTIMERVNLALGWAFLKREEGQGAVEYALVVLGVAAIMVLAVAGFTGHISTFMTKAGTKLESYVP